jgi:8-oxo-dGTP diphosphatase
MNGDDDSRLDRAWRVALRVAYRVLSVYWRLFRPRTEGVCVLVWHGGRLLLVRHSYKPGLGVPAGGPQWGEAPRLTAVRELGQEVGLFIAAERLELLGDFESRHEIKRDHLIVFEVELERPPEVRIDRREIVWADFADPTELEPESLWPPLPAMLARSRYGASTSSISDDSPGTPIRSGNP